MVSLRDEFIEVENGVPVVRWDRIIVVFSASAFTAWLAGLLDFMRGLGSGLASTIGGIGSWVSTTISKLFGIPTGAIDAALASNAEFLSFLGPLAPLAVIGEIVLVTYLLVGGATSAVDMLRGGLS